MVLAELAVKSYGKEAVILLVDIPVYFLQYSGI